MSKTSTVDQTHDGWRVTIRGEGGRLEDRRRFADEGPAREWAEEQTSEPTAREKMLADLRQRIAWREKSATEYRLAGNNGAADYFTGQADGFASAVYIIEHYHPDAGR